MGPSRAAKCRGWAPDIYREGFREALSLSMDIRNQSVPAAIVRNPAICRGVPTLRGTRIPVEMILVHLRAGYSREEIFRHYPRLPAALRCARGPQRLDYHRAERDGRGAAQAVRDRPRCGRAARQSGQPVDRGARERDSGGTQPGERRRGIVRPLSAGGGRRRYTTWHRADAAPMGQPFGRPILRGGGR